MAKDERSRTHVVSDAAPAGGSVNDPRTAGLGDTLLTVERAVALLRAIVGEGGGITVREAARLVGTSSSSAYRLLRTLTESGFVERRIHAPGFGPGPELYRLASLLLDSNEVREAAANPMGQLLDQWRETVLLCLRARDQLLFFHRLASPQPLQYVVALGELVHLHAGAAGRSVMAFLAPEEVTRIVQRYGLPRYTDRTITDPAALRAELGQVRAKGFASSIGERVEGSVGVAAPIFDVTGAAVGCIEVTMPLARFREIDVEAVGQSVRAAAQTTSLRLGHGDVEAPSFTATERGRGRDAG